MSNTITNRLLDIWDIIFDVIIVLKTTLPCIILGIFNKAFFSYLPYAVFLDLILFYICLVLSNLYQLKELKKRLSQYQSLGYGLRYYSDEQSSEIYKQWLDFIKTSSTTRFLNKEITIVQVENTAQMEGLVCVPFSHQNSIVFLPKECDLEDPIYKAKLAHEFSHCINHDEYINIRYKLLTSAIVYIVLSSAFGLSYFSLIALLLGIISMITALVPAAEIAQEMEANKQALNIMELLYGEEAREDAANMFCANCNQQLQKYFESIKNKEIQSVGKTVKEYYSNYYQIIALENDVDKDLFLEYYNDMVIQYEKSKHDRAAKYYRERLDAVQSRKGMGKEVNVRPYSIYAIVSLFLLMICAYVSMYKNITTGISCHWFGFVVFITLIITINIIYFILCKKKIQTLLFLGVK